MKKVILILVVLVSSFTYSQAPRVKAADFIKMTTAQRDALPAAHASRVRLIFNSTTNQWEYYNNGVWTAVSSGGGGGTTETVSAGFEIDVTQSGNDFQVASTPSIAAFNGVGDRNTWIVSLPSSVVARFHQDTNDDSLWYYRGGSSEWTEIADKKDMLDVFNTSTDNPTNNGTYLKGNIFSLSAQNEELVFEDVGNVTNTTLLRFSDAMRARLNTFSIGAHTVDTKLTEAEVDAFVANNGYLTNNDVTLNNSTLTGITYIPAGSNMNYHASSSLSMFGNATFHTNISIPFNETYVNGADNTVDGYVLKYNDSNKKLELQQDLTGGGGGIPLENSSPITITSFWFGTQAQYDAIGTGNHDANTSYMIIE